MPGVALAAERLWQVFPLFLSLSRRLERLFIFYATTKLKVPLS